MPLSFKQRFCAGLPQTPPELDLPLDAFIVFESESLPDDMGADAKQLLLAEGLPESAPPFLSFSTYSTDDIESLRAFGDIPASFFPLGQTAYGDLLGIDTDTKEIVYFNHDNNNQRVFINTSLAQFLECLCAYQEHLHAETRTSPLDAIEQVDAPAAQPGTMWHTEALSD
ncbi:SUKH-4 family immunity protein [Paenalcaligenes sp. Me52]|uniref:SUKH-4 family immunity protein n=1 Tax=Paenalcaligenes sp. Me52 TaxID=3392038 RepID=UPI003D2760B4